MHRDGRKRRLTMHNPYAPPEAKVSDVSAQTGAPVTTEKLYTFQQIALASFLGSFLAAGWFFGKNYAALGEPEKKWPALAIGFAAAVAAGVIGYFLPDRVPNVVAGLACYWATRTYAEMKFGKIVAAHLAAGGPKGSWWVVVGVSLLFLIAFVGVFAVVFVVFFPAAPR
jgi:hypothetical protein